MQCVVGFCRRALRTVAAAFGLPGGLGLLLRAGTAGLCRRRIGRAQGRGRKGGRARVPGPSEMFPNRAERQGSLREMARHQPYS